MVMFGMATYTFNESDRFVTIDIVKVGQADRDIVVRVSGGKINGLNFSSTIFYKQTFT